MASSGGKIVPPELLAPPCPPEVEHLWEWFAELSSGRSSNGFGANPLGWADIEAWARLTDRAPSVWEVGLLKRLDGVYLEVTAPKPTPQGSNAVGGSGNPRVRR